MISVEDQHGQRVAGRAVIGDYVGGLHLLYLLSEQGNGFHLCNEIVKLLGLLPRVNVRANLLLDEAADGSPELLMLRREEMRARHAYVCQ